MSSNNRVMISLYLTPQEDQKLTRAVRHTSKGKLDVLSEWIENGINHADDIGAEAASLTTIKPATLDESTAVKRNVYISIKADSRATQLANDAGISKDTIHRHFFEKALEATLAQTA